MLEHGDKSKGNLEQTEKTTSTVTTQYLIYVSHIDCIKMTRSIQYACQLSRVAFCSAGRDYAVWDRAITPDSNAHAP